MEEYKPIFKESELLVNPQSDVAIEMQNALQYLSILRSNLKTPAPRDSHKVTSNEDGEYLVRKEAQRLMTHEKVPAEHNRFKALCFLYSTYCTFIGIPEDTLVQSAEQGDSKAMTVILTTLLHNYDEVRRVAFKHQS